MIGSVHVGLSIEVNLSLLLDAQLTYAHGVDRLHCAHVGHTAALSPIPKADLLAQIVAAVCWAFHTFGAKGPGRIALLDLADGPLPRRLVATATARLHCAPDLHFSTPRRPRRMPKQSKSRRAIASHW